MKVAAACLLLIACGGPAAPREPALGNEAPTLPMVGQCIFGELDPWGHDALMYGVTHARTQVWPDGEQHGVGAVRLGAATLYGVRVDGLLQQRLETLLPRFEKCWDTRATMDPEAMEGGELQLDAEISADGKVLAIDVITGPDAIAPCADELARLRVGTSQPSRLTVRLRFERPAVRTAAEYAWLADAAAQVEALPALSRCWRSALQREPAAGESAVVALVLEDGLVRSTEVADPWDDDLRDCIAKAYASETLAGAPAGELRVACSLALLPPPGPWPGHADQRLALFADHVDLDGETVGTWSNGDEEEIEIETDWTQEVYPDDVDVGTKPHWMELAVDGATPLTEVTRAIRWARVNGQEVRLADHDVVVGAAIAIRHDDAPSSDEPAVREFRGAIALDADGETPWSALEPRLAGVRYVALPTD